MGRIVIIGAGLTGLSTALHLEKNGIHDYIIIDKESSSGGLCRSFGDGNFIFDYTGHVLHSNNPFFQRSIEEDIGLHQFNTITRRAFIYSQQRYTPYPYQINLHGLPLSTILSCTIGFILRKLHQLNTSSEQAMFPDWIRHTFGSGFARHFFLPYQQKIFAHPLNTITASWTGRFVPHTSLKEIILGAIKKNGTPLTGYNSTFLYPKIGGISLLAETYTRLLKTKIRYEYECYKIDVQKKIVWCKDQQSLPYDYLVSTIPLDYFLRMITKNRFINTTCADKLVCNSLMTLMIGVAKPNLYDAHWIYYPEHSYPFYRVIFPYQLSKTVTPLHHSSLLCEYAYRSNNPLSLRTQEKACLTHLCSLFNFTPKDIAFYQVSKLSHGYVIYDQWREQHLPNLLNTLQNLSILSTGRYGAWKYSSMQEAFIDGKDAAEWIGKHDTINRLITKKTRYHHKAL